MSALAVTVCAGVIGVLVLWDGIQQSSARRPRASTVALAGFVAAALLPLLFPQQGAGTSFDDFQNDASATSRPSIILLILDTVRADHLSIYGYGRNTTPNLAEFLEREPTAMVYQQAHAPGTWTLPTHATLFTGAMASQHSVRYLRLSDHSPLIANQLQAGRTLAELLGEQGYLTAFVYANSFISQVRGFDRGFDHYLKARGLGKLPVIGEELRRIWLPGQFPKAGIEHTSATVINEHILDLLQPCTGRPCFIVANYMEAHAPYAPAPPYAGAFSSGLSIPGDGDSLAWAADPSESPEVVSYKKALYDEELLGLDAALGELLSDLRAGGFLEHAWLFITSDHGEAFLEHGEGSHGTTIHSEVTRIPLIVRPPGEMALPGEGEAVDLLDVTATIASIGAGRVLGPGRDLRAHPASRRRVLIENFPVNGDLAHSIAVIDGSTKLINEAGRLELYDLAADPLEQDDLAPDQAALVEQMEASLPSLATPEAGKDHEALTLSQKEVEQLRALGYLGQ
jgi:arylsulfatase A-like enzyme